LLSRRSTQNLKLILFDTKELREKPDDFVIRRALNRWGRDPNFQFIVMQSDNRALRSARLYVKI
jgi:hypothetical protein